MKNPRTPLSCVLAALVVTGVVGIGSLSAQTPSTPTGTMHATIERIRVHGPSLEGNLEGDDPTRDVVVYLPPSYASDTTRHYPVVYFLHGYGVGAEAYVQMTGLESTVDSAIQAGAHEMIVVMPDANSVYSGSMYSNSPTTGDWENFVSHDLVAYIDSHYRTVPGREGRGLAGHSMGGYGTIRIGMKHPESFSALYAMSSCCLYNNPMEARGGAARGRGNADADGNARAQSNAARGDAARGQGAGAGAGAGRGRGGGLGNALSAQAAAWAPNPMNPPQYFDVYTRDGELDPLIAAKWVANSPLVMVDQYVPNLKRYTAIALDVGDQDTLRVTNESLEESLTRLGIDHTFEVYEGNHGNRVRERFETEVIPFFSEYLAFPFE